jgi:hypothetical protein
VRKSRASDFLAVFGKIFRSVDIAESESSFRQPRIDFYGLIQCGFRIRRLALLDIPSPSNTSKRIKLQTKTAQVYPHFLEFANVVHFK